MDADQGYPIKVVVRRTGLSPHVIRVWEKRYQAVEPMRTDTNRRRYSDADIERLLLFQRARSMGRSIGQIAHLTTERLRELVHEDEMTSPPPEPTATADETTEAPPAPLPASHLETCLDAIGQLDPVALEETLMQAQIAMSQPMFIERLIAPLMESVGERWRDGSFRVVCEHLATAVVRAVCSGLSTRVSASAFAPKIVVTTPRGQLHEIGALMAASMAESDGWQAIYLGPNLPAEEIAAAAQLDGVRAVALSVVHPPDDPHMATELLNLRRNLSPDIDIIVGGRGSHGYHAVLNTIEATQIQDFETFREHLETLRSSYV
jgi:DNA-binding transcriptional MerR regulator/methylmalonyl-CoA mutase cobalamin-binding subunit